MSWVNLIEVASHVIDTGDSAAPIKQHPKHVPFALLSKVD